MEQSLTTLFVLAVMLHDADAEHQMALGWRFQY